MKKILTLLMATFAAIFIFACGEQAAKTQQDASKKTVVASTSFLADMVEQIAGDAVNVETIVPAGEDPHLYVAKPQDLEKIQSADLILYHGLHFEGKMQDVLEKKGVAVSRDFNEKDLTHLQEDGSTVVDPHFWFDIALYKQAVSVASEELVKLLPEKQEALVKNTSDYQQSLDALHEENVKLLAEIPKESRYLITPHDAFNYFAKSYDIEVVAPQGISTDSEVANKDIEKTADFIVNNKVKAIFSESTTNPERMQKLQEVVRAKGYDVKVVSGEHQELYSDSLAPKGEPASTFIKMYQHNVKLIHENLR